MSRLIDADVLKESLKESRDRCTEWIADCDETMKPRAEQALYTFNECIMRINSMPTVEERKKGKWIKQPYMNGTWGITCSNCMRLGMIGSGKGFNYCPHCGADMRGEV